MNDPVLNRKLFRHQAQIIHNKIPKYQTGGPPQSPFTATGFQQAAGSAIPRRNFLKDLAWLASPGKYVKGAKYAYGTYKAARAATKLKPDRLKGTWKSMLPFTKTTGPRSAWQTLKHKYPKTTGGITAAVGGSFAYSGQKTAREGYKEKDYGKMALGIGEMGIGVPWASKAIQAMRIPGVSGKAAKVSKVVKGKSWKDPKTWGPFALIGGGALTAKDAETADYTKEEQEVWKIIQTIAKDIENVTQEEINKAIEIYEKQKTVKADPNKKPDNLGETGTNEMKADEVPPGSGSPVTGDEANILAKQKEKNTENQANVLKTKFDTADMQTQREFLKFRESITNLTGTYGNDRDLILMKMASGMMTGKTGSKGLRGFMDVTGQAMGPTVDTALALSNAQKGRDTDLATAFLKMKAEQAEAAEGGGLALKGAQKRFLIKDPASPYGYKVVTGQYDENTGQIMEHLGNQQYQIM